MTCSEINWAKLVIKGPLNYQWQSETFQLPNNNKKDINGTKNPNAASNLTLSQQQQQFSAGAAGKT